MTVRRILLLGATGGTGRQVLEQGTAAELEVTALVRNPDTLPVARGVRVVAGDIRTDSPAVRRAFADQDAVVSTLGVGRSFTSGGLIAQAARLIVTAMREQGVRRLVFTSAFGVGATWQDIPLLPRLFMTTLLRDVYADKAAGEQVIRNSGLDWTIVYPTGLTDGPRTDAVRVGDRLRLAGFPRVSRADVAAVLLRQLSDRSGVGKSLLVSS